MPRPGLQWQIIFTLILVMVAASFLIALVVMSVTKNTILTEKIEGTRFLANAIQDSINVFASNSENFYPEGGDNGNMARLLKLFSQEGDVKNIVIVDVKGKVIASSEPAQIGTLLQDPDVNEILAAAPVSITVPQTSQNFFKEANGTLSFGAPFYFKNQKSGAMRITLSLNEIQAALKRSYKLILAYIIFTSILITLFGIFLFSRLIVRPVKKLLKATEAIGEGDYAPNAFEGNRNEIGQLSFAFNRMAEKINEHQKQLRAQIASLAKLNRELKQSQKEVLAEEKLALVGKLAAGVAHEIGNPLSSILGYISLLQKQETWDHESADYLQRTEQELNRINKTIRELLDFSRLKKAEKTTVDIKQALESSLSLVKHQKKFQDITVTAYSEPDLWLVEGDENQFQQVFLNLLLNAGEAVSEQGKIAILADRMVWKEGSLVRLNASLPDDFSSFVPEFGLGQKEVCLNDIFFEESQTLVRILFADNGEGIERENLNNIFDPFFTTREPGKGTGLGLAICSRIVESFGGTIVVRSEVKKGSAFLVLIPAVKGEGDG